MENKTSNLFSILCPNFPCSYENTRRYYDVDRWVRHHHYIPQNIQNDIAVVKVKGVIEFNEAVQPIRISSSKIPAGAHVQLTGWGKVHVSTIHI